MRIAKRAAWLFVAGLAACAAIKPISREEWTRHFGGDITHEFQSEEQLQEYTASLFQPTTSSSSTAQAVGRSRERGQKQKRQFVLALEDSNLVATHAQLREAVQAAGGSYKLAANGRYAIVHADADTVNRLQTDVAPSLRGVLHVRGAMKVARSVNRMQCSDGEQQAGLLAALSVTDEASFQQSVSWLQQASSEHGWELELPKHLSGRGKVVVGVRVSCSSVMEAALQLAELESVMSVEPRPQYKLANHYAQGITQSAKVGDTPLYSANLTGNGEIVGVSDSGIDMDHCYFQDDNCDPFDQLDMSCRKVVYYEMYQLTNDLPDLDDNGHGTHVTGSIAGACIDCSGNKEKFHGMAYNARLAFIDLGDDSGSSLSTPGDLYTDLFGVLYNQGAKISSHSWGSTVDADNDPYPSAAEDADQFMYDNEDALILFAAGNAGEDGPSTILSPGVSKNVLSLGASLNAHEAFGDGAASKYNEDNLAEFSSLGPTFGDRLKPEVCAPGMYIESADAENGNDPVCSRLLMSGTSMATPITAGNAALAREYFRVGYYPTGEPNPADGFTPSGALLKAVLIHGTRRMKGRFQGNAVVSIPYPGNEQGFGRIALGDVLATSKNNYFTLIVKGDVAAGDHELTTNGDEHHVSVQTTSMSKYRRALVATLVWIDPPTGSGALVNNLDLFITDDDTGTVYRPLWTTTVDNTDDKNPVEKVVISEPTLLGNYTVTVRAESLITAQKYALVITGAFEGYDYDTPPEDDEPSQLDKLLEDLGISKQEFTIGVVLIGAFVLFSCCCGERRRRKRGDRQRDAFHADEIL